MKKNIHDFNLTAIIRTRFVDRFINEIRLNHDCLPWALSDTRMFNTLEEMLQLKVQGKIET